MPLLLIILCLLLLLVLYILYVYLVKVKVGPPPIKELVLAYKYQYLGKYSHGFYKTLKRIFPYHRFIKFCYSGPRSSTLEFALGLIIDDKNWKKDQTLLGNLIDLRLMFFKTPNISNALYSEYFVIPWLPFTTWIATAMAYWKHCRYSEDYNLCGYPVVEVISNYKLSIVVPLLRQDDFVVAEAERIVYGSKVSAMLEPLSAPKSAPNIQPIKTTQVKKVNKVKPLRATKG